MSLGKSCASICVAIIGDIDRWGDGGNISHGRWRNMKKAAYNIVPSTENVLKTMGEQIKLARLRRDMPVEVVAERAGISRSSLWKVESGSPAVAMGIYAAVLHTLNEMDEDLSLIAKEDDFGRKLQDDELKKKRASRRKRA